MSGVRGVSITAKQAKKKVSEKEAYPNDTIRVYFNGIRKFPLLSATEEKRLARLITKGDTKARERMIESNLRLVVNISKRYLNRGLSFPDLIEEGNLGLIRSVEGFKASKGCKFSTYATYWIRQSIERAIANKSRIIRLPIHVSADKSKLLKARREYTSLYHKTPTLEELSSQTGFSLKYLTKLDTVGAKTFAMESVASNGSDFSFSELLPDESITPQLESVAMERRAAMVADWLERLDETGRHVITRRFGLDAKEPETLEAIAMHLGVTRERIRQIEVRALRKLKGIIKEVDNINTFDAV
ncbi:MAG: sigma-70 family RNA polymerase sigma factor [Proteobacteria bacterium]|nr:sigma-70 family RNA polymerase sigma factor [Pseudomonadota bacterium]